jgi:hypothetical protein
VKYGLVGRFIKGIAYDSFAYGGIFIPHPAGLPARSTGR